MTDLIFWPVTKDAEIRTTAALAARIWMEHYLPIIGEEQTAYMIQTFQSADAIRRQIERDRYQYYLLKLGSTDVGYISLHAESQNHAMFLSKLYVEKRFRGQGFSRAALRFIEEICRRENLGKIYLTVNKHNFSSLAVYEKLGFVSARDLVTDIGGGFVMDDYVMEKYL